MNQHPLVHHEWCNGLKYGPFENFDNFWFVIFYGDHNIG
jgi:hypothetical protein